MTQLASLRLVSLLPSATEIIACLGLTDRLVGISHECDYPPEIKDRAICTSARLSIHQPSGEIHKEVDKLLTAAVSIYEINLDVLTQLQPTHIITQDQCDVCAVSFPEVEIAVAKLTNSHPQIISLQPDTIADVWADIQRVGETLNVDWNRLCRLFKLELKPVKLSAKISSPIRRELLVSSGQIRSCWRETGFPNSLRWLEVNRLAELPDNIRPALVGMN